MGRYIGIVHQEGKSAYGVSFAELPGCTSAGKSLDEATRNAHEALSLHLDGMRADGEDIREPLDLDAVRKSEQADDAVAFVVVESQDVADHAVRVNITVHARLLEKIDRYASEHGIKRSALIAEAARRMIG